MWTKLDDALLDHRKVYVAGDLIGRNGPAIVIGFYAVGLMWTNKHLTDGHLPQAVVKRFKHAEQPLVVADALVKAGLWIATADGYQIHDFHDHNPRAEDVRVTRDEVRQARSDAGKRGAKSRWNGHSKTDG